MNSPLNVFKLKPAIGRSLTCAALLLSASTLINAGESKAVTTCFLSNLSTCTLTVGDKVVNNIVLMNYTPDPFDRIKFTQSLGIWQLSTLFENGTQFLLTPRPKLTFDVTITDPTKSFKRSELNADVNTTFGGTVGLMNNYSNFTPGSASISPNPLVSMGGMPTAANFAGDPKKVSVATEWFTTGSALINTITSSFTQTDIAIPNVPAPLPLLGAGAAFGFSRRLRRRIKTSATV